jgi:hypothetical protein
MIRLTLPPSATLFPARQIPNNKKAAPPIDGRPPQTLGGLMDAHDVAAYLSGHLHDAFGPRLHALARKSAGGAGAGGAGAGGAWAADLETADWKLAKRFRLLTVDGGALSFADFAWAGGAGAGPDGRPTAAPPAASAVELLRLLEAQGGGGGGAAAATSCRAGDLASVEPSRRVAGHLVLLTAPPDARYGPLTRPQAAALTSAAGCALRVRALVLPCGSAGRGNGTAPPQPPDVRVAWQCGAGAAGARGAAPMACAPSAVTSGEPCAGVIAELGPAAAAACAADGGALSVQILAVGADGAASTSELRRVHLPRGCPGALAAGAGGDGAPPPAPLRRGVLEAAVPSLNWPLVSRLGFWALLVLLLALLWAPQLWPRAIERAVARAASKQAIAAEARPPAGLKSPSAGLKSPPAGLKSSSASARLVDAARRSATSFTAALAAAALAPLRWSADAAAAGGPAWLAVTAAWGANLALGPWFAARFLSDAPLGALVPSLGGVLFFGRALPTEAGAGAGELPPWASPLGPLAALAPCEDAFFVAGVLLLFAIVPTVLWVLWLAGGWVRRPAAPPLSAAQAATALPLAWMHFHLLRRLTVSYGATAVLLSPAAGWCVPLHAALLLGLRRRLRLAASAAAGKNGDSAVPGGAAPAGRSIALAAHTE